MELDFLGQIYACTMNKNHLGTFSISVCLKEEVQPQILQQAVKDLVKRLPFLSGRLRPDFLYELLIEPPQVELENSSLPIFTDYYNEGHGHVLRVVYGKQYFKVEASHIITDGRGLSKITNGLLVRYFELMGLEVDKGDIIDCTSNLQSEEIEDASERFANSKKVAPKNKSSKIAAYKHGHLRFAPTRVISKKFDLEKIKFNAKAHGITVSEYILAHIFSAIAEERNASGSKKPIVAEVPIDNRSFFPSKTIRNFVGNKKVVMPETEDFSFMAQQIRSQFASVDTDFIQDIINEMQNAKKNLGRLPRLIRKFVIKIVNHQMIKTTTTMFSNLGLVKLPKEIEERIDMLEFLISPTEGLPYTFSCIAVGNVLTLSITVDLEGNDTIENIFKRIEEDNT